MTIPAKTVGINLQLLRLREQMTLTQLSKVANQPLLNALHLRLIEEGKVRPSITELHAIARALGCRVQDLLIDPAADEWEAKHSV